MVTGTSRFVVVFLMAAALVAACSYFTSRLDVGDVVGWKTGVSPAIDEAPPAEGILPNEALPAEADAVTTDAGDTSKETDFSILGLNSWMASGAHSRPPDRRLLDALARARGLDPKNCTYVFRVEELDTSQSPPEVTSE